MDKGFFGNLFDFDHDGKLDTFEKAADFMAFTELMNESEGSSVFGEDEEHRDEIESAGLDFDELSFMDEDERREALEDAGLDPDDYDF